MLDLDSPEFLAVHEDCLEAGSVVAGRYRIVQSLGVGGFAQVYLATHLEVESLKVAIKVLHPSQTNSETLDRFRNEAKLLAMLRNRHTVKLTDFGVSDEGIAFLVMEYVEGTALDRIISARGAMRDPDVCRFGIGVLKVLIEAHSVGVIHRDLKPANIVVVTEPGEKHVVPRVLDFGIAKVLGGASPVEDRILNEDGSYEPVVYCTLAYAAPELLRGRPLFQTDLYALGLVMIEMLEGTTPYEYLDTAPAASPHLWPTPVPLGLRTQASVAVDVIRRSVAKELSDRYESAGEMLADLERAYEELRTIFGESEVTDNYFTVNEDPPVKPVSQTAMFVQTAAVGIANRTGIPAATEVSPPGEELSASTPSISGEKWVSPSGGTGVPGREPTALHDHTSIGPVFTPPPVLLPQPPLKATPAAAPVDEGGGVLPAVSGQTESSQTDNVALFGLKLKSGRVTLTGIVVVILAVLLPAVVAVWSVIRYAKNN